MLPARARARSSPAPSTDVIAASVAEYWSRPFLAGSIVTSSDSFVLTVNDGLPDDRRVQVLTVPGQPTRAVVRPDVVSALGSVRDAIGLQSALIAAGITLNGADNLYYLPVDARARASTIDPEIRRLTSADADLFARFELATSEQDRDDSFVELDHWAVFGAIVEGEVVSAASAYPFADSPVADIGVLTVESARGRGFGRRVVRALGDYALGQGLEPQFSCQLDNAASIALAERVGLELFGTWDVVAPD